MSNKLSWFELPAANLERAVKFYSEVFQNEMQVFEVDSQRTVALMPPGASIEGDIEPAGTLLQTANFEPSQTGTVVYFDPNGQMETLLERVEAAGGKVTFPRFRIGNGYLATFLDSEGNTVGLLEWDK